MCINTLRLVASNGVKKQTNKQKQKGVYRDESCLAFTYVPACMSQVALACPTGPCWSRRWWCADWSVLLLPANLLPGRSRSSSYKRRKNIIPTRTQLLIILHTSVTSSVPLLREESAAKRGCKHQAREKKKRRRGMLQRAQLNKRHYHFPFTYHRPTSPTWTGAFNTGNRCKDTMTESTAGGEQDGTKYKNILTM